MLLPPLPSSFPCTNNSIEMTVTPLATAPPKKIKIKISGSCHLPGGCAGLAVGATNQEKAGNFERQEPQVAAVDLALPLPPRVQEPVKRKLGRDAIGDINWASKKQRSAVAAARERGNAIAEANRAAAAAASSPVVQEPACNWDCVDCIWKKGHGSLRWSACVTVDEWKQEKLRPCEFAAPVHGLDSLCKDSEVNVLELALPVKRDHQHNGDEACWLIKKSCTATAAACECSNGAVDQVNMAGPSTPSSRTREPVRRRVPKQGSKASGQRGLKRTRYSDCKTTRQPFPSLSSALQWLGVTNVTPILVKTLTASDCDLNQFRLLLSRLSVMDSPVMNMLTPDESLAVYRNGKDGQPVEALDRHGRFYNLTFKYLSSNKGFRLIGEWPKFVIHNGVCEGHLVELGVFRADGKLMLMSLNYAMEGWIPEEVEAAEGLLMLSDFNDGTMS